jgi:DNA replication protein DnaC
MAELKDVGVLILDDLGAQKDTDFSLAKLDMIINYRYINELQTVVTANVDNIDELPSRIASRLSEGNVCKINMPDFRKIKSEQRAKNLVKGVKDVSN